MQGQTLTRKRHKLGENNNLSRGPLHNAHVDQSYDGAVIRLKEVLPVDEADDLLASQRRWQIINVCLHIHPKSHIFMIVLP